MTLEKWQTLSQVAVLVGVILTGAGGFWSWKLDKLLTQQKEQEEKKEAELVKKKAATSGVLVPKDEVLLSTEQDLYPMMQIGTMIVDCEKLEGRPVFIFDGADVRVVRRGNRVLISTTIRGDKGTIIAELVENEWKTNSNNNFDRNYTDSALEVKNPQGQVILQVEVLPDRVKFQGLFQDSYGKYSGVIADPKGAAFLVSIPSITKECEIIPLFKYPSDLHLGELVRPVQ